MAQFCCSIVYYLLEIDAHMDAVYFSQDVNVMILTELQTDELN